jgi:hypothetical protein
MKFKITKKKLFFSLIPFYLLLGFIPFLIDAFWDSFDDSKIGSFLTTVSVFCYLIFWMLLLPVYPLFKLLGLADDRMLGVSVWALPDITFLGYIILALIYTMLFYLIISIFQKNNS